MIKKNLILLLVSDYHAYEQRISVSMHPYTSSCFGHLLGYIMRSIEQIPSEKSTSLGH